MWMLCRIADAARDAWDWLRDALMVAVLAAASAGLLLAVLRAIQVAVP